MFILARRAALANQHAGTCPSTVASATQSCDDWCSSKEQPVSENVEPVPVDIPIEKEAEDALGRAASAKAFARQVIALDASRGLVVGVLGPWGSGKTSFINLSRPEFAHAGVQIFDFNPWLFSGAEQLVDFFFGELGAWLKLRKGLGDIARDLTEYGAALGGFAWLPVAGPWVGRASALLKLIRGILGTPKSGVRARRTKLESALAKIGKPILVVLDDVDRLTTTEIKHVFRLVRLTGSFPNIIYLVALDRYRVEAALSEDGIVGRDFIEKILQLVYDLPATPGATLREQLLSTIGKALEGRDGPFDRQRWTDVFFEIVLPLFRNMRDVRRYAVAVRSAVDSLYGQVEFSDVLALESVRMMLPEIFSKIHSMVPLLTDASDQYFKDPDSAKTTLLALVELGKSHKSVVNALLHRIFPATQRHLSGTIYRSGSDWLRSRRVAHSEVLLYYLERVAGSGLTALGQAEAAFVLMEDREAFERYMRSVEPSRLEDVISALESFQSDFRPIHVVPGSIVLMNLRSVVPARPLGMFEFGSDLAVGRVVLRLFRAMKDPVQLADAVRTILTEITSLSDRLDVISTIDYDGDTIEELVPRPVVSQIVRNWREQVRAASSETLQKESHLLDVLLQASLTVEGEPKLLIPDDPPLMLAVLRSARTESRRQGGSSRAIIRTLMIQWNALIRLFGTEAELRRRIEALGSETAREPELMALVADYVSGRVRDPSARAPPPVAASG
jgi:hypothetical protein